VLCFCYWSVSLSCLGAPDLMAGCFVPCCCVVVCVLCRVCLYPSSVDTSRAFLRTYGFVVGCLFSWCFLCPWCVVAGLRGVSLGVAGTDRLRSADFAVVVSVHSCRCSWGLPLFVFWFCDVFVDGSALCCRFVSPECRRWAVFVSFCLVLAISFFFGCYLKGFNA